MKRYLGFIRFCLLVALFALPQSSHAQSDTFGHVFLFDMLATEKPNMVTQPTYFSAPDTAVYKIFGKLKQSEKSGFARIQPKSPIMLGVKLKPSLTQYFSESVQSVSKDYQTFVISDHSDAVLIAMGINAGNVKDMQYHVVENDSTELVPWSPIPKLEQNYGAKQPYGFVGKYNAPGKRIMVEVVDKKNYSIREGVIFDWRVNFKPVLEQLSLAVPNGYFNVAYTHINHGYATQFDRKTGLPLDLKFPVDSVLNITVKLKKDETISRSVHLMRTVNGKPEMLDIGHVDRWGYFVLDRTLFEQPGIYELLIKRQEKVPVWDYAQMMSLEFQVLPPPLFAKKYSVKQLMPYIAGMLVFMSITFVAARNYVRRRFRSAEQRQINLQLKLRSIRAQLNPHFMFNALSSIQNLMNKDKLLEANHYLSKFANLTRKVLNTSEQEIISLEDELKIADDYLQMEQLRFGFNYIIDVDPDINKANTDIPAMLLQPFIENAVKHGIALLKEKGTIQVSVQADGQNLILSVKDNGKGFDVNRKPSQAGGFGLKLSHERIDLLNQVYKNQPSTLTIDSSAAGTQITVTLNNWI